MSSARWEKSLCSELILLLIIDAVLGFLAVLGLTGDIGLTAIAE